MRPVNKTEPVSDSGKPGLIRGDGDRAIRGILNHIGDKSTLPVVATRTLRHLKRDGLISRTAVVEAPPGSNTS